MTRENVIVREIIVAPTYEMGRFWLENHREEFVGRRPQVVTHGRQLRGYRNGVRVHLYDPDSSLSEAMRHELTILQISGAQIVRRED